MRPTIATQEELTRWIGIHPGKSFQWAITSTEAGGIPRDCWSDFLVVEGESVAESMARLPIGKRLLFRVIGSKGGVHVILSSPHEPSARVEIQQYDGPDIDELIKSWKLLKEAQDRLTDDEEKFLKYQRQVNAEISLSRSGVDKEREAMERSRNALNLDRESIERSIKENLRLLKDVDDVYADIDELRTKALTERDSLIQRAQTAENKNLTAATIQHVADRVQIMIACWRIKSGDAELPPEKRMPPAILAEIQRGMMLISLERFYAQCGEGEIQKIANSLALLPATDKVKIYQAVFGTFEPRDKLIMAKWIIEQAQAASKE